MELYKCKKGNKIRLCENADIPPVHRKLEQGEVLTFSHIDGMYSFCRDSAGNIVHPAAWSEVEVVE